MRSAFANVHRSVDTYTILNGLQPREKLSVFEQVGVETGGLTEVAVYAAKRDHRRWRDGRTREKQRELVHEVPGSLGATIPRAINSQGKPFTLQPKCAHKELKCFGFGGEVTMFRMGEDEIQAHQLDLHEGRVDAFLEFVVEDDAADGTASLLDFSRLSLIHPIKGGFVCDLLRLHETGIELLLAWMIARRSAKRFPSLVSTHTEKFSLPLPRRTQLWRTGFWALRFTCRRRRMSPEPVPDQSREGTEAMAMRRQSIASSSAKDTCRPRR